MPMYEIHCSKCKRTWEELVMTQAERDKLFDAIRNKTFIPKDCNLRDENGNHQCDISLPISGPAFSFKPRQQS